MKTKSFSVHVLATIIACTTFAFVGCGDDDDDNDVPSNTSGGKTNKGGATGNSAGDEGSGGTTSAKGGSSSKGGSTSVEGGGPSSGGGDGDPKGGAGGSGGGEIEPGGAGGVGGAAPIGEPCTELSGDEPACYADCAPVKTDDSLQFLNRCSAGVECTPFDNTSLGGWDDNGELPPLP